MNQPFRSGGSQLCDAWTRIGSLIQWQKSDPADFVFRNGPATLERAVLEYQDQLLAMRQAVEQELASLSSPPPPLPEKAAGHIQESWRSGV